jgi:2-amino-4-hydroxy-6-hydroxymethyldihydropteridine diphosphokinase
MAYTVSTPSSRPLVRAYIGIGGNLGDARQQVETALQWLHHLPDTAWVAASPLYRSAPWQADGPDYVNAVAAVDTHLTAPHLLHQLQQLEQRAGRERPYLNAPRTLDLDLLLYGQGRIQSPTLTVPHPRWQERAFVLIPLADLAPEWVSADMREAVADQRIVPI